MNADGKSKMRASVRREMEFPQSRETVWQALTDPDSLAEWMYPNDFEPRLGHRFTFKVPPKPEVGFDGLTVRCEVTVLRPPEELAFTWVAEDIDTVVTYKLTEAQGGTRVFFEQSGFEPGPAHKGAEYGWKSMHEKLRSLLAKASRP